MKQRIVGLGLTVGCLVMSACGDTSGGGSSEGAGSGGASSSSASSAAGGGSAGEGGRSLGGCDAECTSTQFCSVTGVCLDAGACAADGDCAEGTVCDPATSRCIPGGGCGAQEATAEAIPPNLLVVLDRSCSMRGRIGTETKWSLAVDAIQQLTTTYAGRIRFGLTLFPDTSGSQCGQGPIPVPVGEGTESTIQSLLTGSLDIADPNYPDGPCETNIDAAMDQAAVAEPALNDTARQSFVLLLTDGRQSDCRSAGGDAGTLQTITDLHGQRDVGTFVVGFGSGGIDAAQLNAFAVAGGVPTADPQTKYYLAEDQASLATALQAIADRTIGCVFSLDSVPPDPSKVYVYFDNATTPVAQDPSHTDGWDYDATSNQVVFYGASCDGLRTGAVRDIDVVFGCMSPTPD